MNIEIGKWYKNKLDRKCIVLDINPDFVTIAFQRSDNWETNTAFHKDIISEWVDKPTIDRKILPAWYKWAAMDTNKKWFSYCQKPVWSMCNLWVCGNDPIELNNGNLCVRIPAEYSPKWEGKPEDSLIELDNQTV